MTPAPLVVRLFFALLLAAFFIRAVCRNAFLIGKDAAHAVVAGDKEWEIHLPQTIMRGRVVYRFVSSHLAILIVGNGRATLPVMAAADSMEKNSFRRLRVRLTCIRNGV